MLQGTIINDGNGNSYFSDESYNNDTVNANETAEEFHEEEDVKDFTNQFKNLFDAFAESIPQGTHEAKSSKNFFKRFSDYVGSKDFEDQVNEKAEKYKVPPKQIAKNFFLKVLGIIGDILGIVVNTVCSVLDTAVSLLSVLLHGAVSVIGKVGNGIASVVTMNQTNTATA